MIADEPIVLAVHGIVGRSEAGGLMRTLLFVQPYDVRRHKLQASGAHAFEDADAAIEAGKHLAGRRHGVVVMRQRVDASHRNLSKPDVLAIYGHVPEEWKKAKRAA